MMGWACLTRTYIIYVHTEHIQYIHDHRCYANVTQEYTNDINELVPQIVGSSFVLPSPGLHDLDVHGGGLKMSIRSQAGSQIFQDMQLCNMC